MALNALESLYCRVASQYPVESDCTVCLFDTYALQRTAFRSLLAVPAMTHISHLIEDAVIDNPGVAEVHASFQFLSRFASQAERYRHIAQCATGTWLYGVNDAPVPPMPRLTVVDTTESPLRDFWWVVAYGPGLSMTLVAEEIPGFVMDYREYRGFYTFAPDVAQQVVALLEHLFPDARHDHTSRTLRKSA